MHKEWEELIPFYVAGSLARPETARLESHLARCPDCRRSVEEWRSVASAVRAEAAAQLRDLPPLSARVLQLATQQAGDRRAPFEQQPFPRRAAPPQRYRSASITLIAAVFTVILFGGLLALTLRGVLPQPAAGGVALLPTDTPFPAATTQVAASSPASTEAALVAPIPDETPSPVPQIIVIEPSATPFVIPSTVPPTQAPLIFNTPVPTRVPLTSAPPPTSAPLLATAPPTGAGAQTFSAQLAPVKGGCTLYAASAAPVSLYAGPGAQFGVVGTMTQADELKALAVTDAGWFQAQYAAGTNLAVGWVRGDQIFTRGNCDGLPVVAPQPSAQPTDAPPTPTASDSLPVVVVSADSVNLRSGPGTAYPVVDMALSGERLPVSARADAADGVWYLVQRGGMVWVSGIVVRLVPAGAVIAPAATIPPLPDPTATVIPFMPTLTPSPTGAPADSAPKPAP